MKRARAGSLHCLAFGAVSWYNFSTEEMIMTVREKDKEKNVKAKRKTALIVLAVLIVVSAAAELIINAGKEDAANVHIQIRCDEVAEAPEMLTDPALAEYIPEDGIALARLKYIAKEGDSVLQILEKICKNNNIEVKKTEDGLIEAIGYLKNGDCGEGSCWVYTVDGKLMSDNPADSKVKGGEDIVWTFALNGGRDIENV